MKTIPLPAILLSAMILLPSAMGEETKPTNESDAFRAAAIRCLRALRADPIQGVPNEEQLRRIAPHLSPGLVVAFRQAAEISHREAAAHPDEKPPWIEDDPFSSLTEGATSWKPGEIHQAPGVLPSMIIHQGYKDAQGNSENWVDKFVFLPHNGTWVLEDILMGGHWATGSTLRGSMPGGLREESDHISFDEKWSFTFGMEGDAVARMAIQPAKSKAGTKVLFQEAGDRCLSFLTHVIWSADSKHFALRLGDAPHTARTQVYTLKDGIWTKVALPELFKQERATAIGNGFKQIHDTLEPLYWRDNQTLVLGCVMTWEKGEEGDGLAKMVAIDFNGAEPKVESVTDLVAPPEGKK